MTNIRFEKYKKIDYAESEKNTVFNLSYTS